MKRNSRVAADEFDAIVVGAGPAGCSCASFLSGSGHKVLLLDKASFPRDKTCGDGISGKSVAMLAELGLTERVEAQPHTRITGVTFSSPGGACVDIPTSKGDGSIEYGYGMRRELMDDVLFQDARKRAAKTVQGFTVTDLLKDGDDVVGVKGTAGAASREFHAKVVVGADGANGIVASKLGVGAAGPEHTCSAIRCYYAGVGGMTGSIELHFFDEVIPGYFWIFPAGEGMANVGVGMVTEDLKRLRVSLKDAMFDAIANNPMIKDRFAGAEMVPGTLKGWSLPFGSKRCKSYGNGWLLVGDAASLVDPFSGEGIGNALYSGKLAADAISDALSDGGPGGLDLSGYERSLKKNLDPELQNSYAMQRLGRNKFLLDLVIRKAARNRDVRDMIAGTITGSLSRKIYESPLTYLRMLATPPYW